MRSSLLSWGRILNGENRQNRQLVLMKKVLQKALQKKKTLRYVRLALAGIFLLSGNKLSMTCEGTRFRQIYRTRLKLFRVPISKKALKKKN